MTKFSKSVFFYILLAMPYICLAQVKATKNNSTSRPVVEMVTNYGNISLELYNETPLHRDNFIALVNKKAYDSLLFHRVIQNFMIQGGDPDSRTAEPNTSLGSGDLGYTIPAEFDPTRYHKKGALAAARDDNPQRASSAIQFYIVQGKVFTDSLLDAAEARINDMLARHYLRNDRAYRPLTTALQEAIDSEDRETYMKLNDSIASLSKIYTNFERYTIPKKHREAYKTVGGTPHLDQNYTVFGQVIEGLDVVDTIAATATDASDRPVETVRILSVRIKG